MDQIFCSLYIFLYFLNYKIKTRNATYNNHTNIKEKKFAHNYTSFELEV